LYLLLPGTIDAHTDHFNFNSLITRFYKLSSSAVIIPK
jgi:hypothetical protein